MKSTTHTPATPGQKASVAFTIPDNTQLRNKTCVVVVTLNGVVVCRYDGLFPPSGGLQIETRHKFQEQTTIVVDTTIAGVTITAARDGNITVTPV